MRKATAKEKSDYPGLYPLHGWLALKTPEGRSVKAPVEDLRGSWRKPDPTWELIAPDGYHFDGYVTHSILEHSLKDVRDHEKWKVALEKCNPAICDG
jgi:hypothetical protein